MDLEATNNVQTISPKNLLIEKIKEYIVNYKKTLKTPALKEELEALKEKSDYYRDAMKGLITIDQLADEDIRVIPLQDREFWEDLKFLATVNKNSVKDGVIKIERSDRKRISSIYHDLNAPLQSRIEYLERQIESAHEEEIYDEIELIEKLINKLSIGLAIDYNEYKMIDMILKDEELLDISEEELYAINKFIGVYMIADHSLVDVSNIPDDDEVSEIIEENQHLIDEQILIDLFAKYGYDYNLLRKEKKTLLTHYGRVDKITSIFEALKNFKVNNDYINNLATILVYSSPEIVNSIFDNIESDKTNELSAQLLFDHYMSTPNLFISGRKVDRKNSGTGTIDIEGEIGLFNNYQANRRFFIEHHIPIASAINKCISVFGTKNQTLEDTYAKFKSYDISDAIIFGKLSCLSAKDVYEMMDLLIENKCEAHLLNNISQSVKFSTAIIRRIILARMLGQDVMHSDGRFYGYISNLKNKSLSIKAKMTEEELDQKTGEVIGETEYFDTESLQVEKEVYDNQVADVIYSRNLDTENNKYISYLDNYFLDSTSSILYNIQGVLISRRKVLRVYGELIKKHDWENNKNLLLYAITYKSILNREQLNTIEQTVDYILAQTKGLK